MHDINSKRTVNCFILTISDTRKLSNDESGEKIQTLLEKSGHKVLGKKIIPDDGKEIRQEIQTRLEEKNLEALILTGGTGISPRDVTYEEVSSFFTKPLDGFGELFRYLSFKEMGAAALLSRAIAGVTQHGILIFSIPGSKKAVTLALEQLILPVLSHATDLARNRTG